MLATQQDPKMWVPPSIPDYFCFVSSVVKEMAPISDRLWMIRSLPIGSGR